MPIAADLPAVEVRTEYFAMLGGMDTETPEIQKGAGRVISARNYEVGVEGGYRRIGGFERFDGRPRPSDADYYYLYVTLSGSISVGDVIEGGTSLATATVVSLDASVSPAVVVITRKSGSFVAAENILVSSVVRGVAVAPEEINAAPNEDAHLLAKYLAAEAYRALITAVPGSGPVRGVVLYKGIVYAFRNNTGGTACNLYKSSSSGWVQVPYYREVSFTAGSVAPTEGGTITQGSNSATVKRVVLQSGSWGAGTAAGRFIITTPSPGEFSAGALTGGASATLSGASTAITMAPGGRFEFDIYNFTGSTDTLRVYGCDGVNRGFEFDGDVLVPISTGMAEDAPSFVRCHSKHLFFAFKGSLQHSGIGLPYQWTVVTGAGELGMGDTITGLAVLPGAEASSSRAMAVFSRSSTHVLYGSSSANWNLVTLSPDVGAIPHTIQALGRTIYLDDRGITVLAAAQEFGNFAYGTISRLVQSLIDRKRGLAQASLTVPSLNQYRLFFSDGTGLTLTMRAGRVAGFMPFAYPKIANVCWSGETPSGEEMLLIGASDGFVYELERGTSFDGADIEAWLRLAFNHSKSPRMRKRYRRAVVDVRGESRVSLWLMGDFSFSDTEVPSMIARQSVLSGGGGYWDESFFYDRSYWDAKPLAQGSAEIDGSGVNLSLLFYHKEKEEKSHRIDGITIHFTPRRTQR